MSSKPPRRETRSSAPKAPAAEVPTGTTPPERKKLNFSVQMTVEMAKYLETLAPEFGLSSGGEVVRELIEARRTWFRLPPYQAARLEEERKARNMPFLSYIQELLARDYEALKAQDAGKPKT